MDTSKTYIQMCDCPEIQDNWVIKAGDCFKIIKGKYYIGEPCEGGSEYFEGDICYADEQALSYDSSGYKYLWLPRQDQLQEMISDNVWETTRYYYAFASEYLTEKDCKDITHEQLWLLYCMAKKHGARWQGAWWEHEEVKARALENAD